MRAKGSEPKPEAEIQLLVFCWLSHCAILQASGAGFADVVAEALPGAVISAVNLPEVIAKLCGAQRGHSCSWVYARELASAHGYPDGYPEEQQGSTSGIH